MEKLLYIILVKKLFILLINLNKRKKDIRLFIKLLEKSIIEFLKIYNINGFTQIKKILVFGLKIKKISAIGIRVKKMDCLSWMFY